MEMEKEEQVPVYWGPADVLLAFDSSLSPGLRSLIQADGLQQIGVFQHAYFRYDYDDPHVNKEVIVFMKEKVPAGY